MSQDESLLGENARHRKNQSRWQKAKILQRIAENPSGLTEGQVRATVKRKTGKPIAGIRSFLWDYYKEGLLTTKKIPVSGKPGRFYTYFFITDKGLEYLRGVGRIGNPL